MNDLIYRQKAIEALDKDIMGGLNYKSILNRLPSAESEIIMCKDCKQFRRWIDTDICFCDITESEISDNDFCSRAERRADE